VAPPKSHQDRLGHRPSAIGYWLLAIGYWLLAIGYWLFIQSLVVIFLMPDVRRSGDVLLDHVPDGAGND
jgi:hypothetical protein